MIIHVPRKTLHAAISDLVKFRDVYLERDDKPTMVRVEADTEFGFNLSIVNITDGVYIRRQMKTKLEAQSDHEKNIVLFVDLDAITGLPFHDEGVAIAMDSTAKFWLECGNRRITIDRRNVKTDELWTFPDYHDAPIITDIVSRDFAAMLRYCIASVATEEVRPILTSLQLSFAPNGLSAPLKLIAADGFRMHIADKNLYGQENNTPYSIQLPGALMRKLLPIIEHSGGSVLIKRVPRTNDKQPPILCMMIGNLEIVCNEVEGKFPAVEHLYKDNAPLYCYADRDSMTVMLRDCLKFKPVYNTVHLKQGLIETESLKGKLSANTNLVFKRRTNHKVVSMPEIALNAEYLLDVIEAMPLRKEASVIIRMDNGDHPLSVEGACDHIGFVGVIMPMSSKPRS